MNDLNAIRIQKIILFFTSWAHVKAQLIKPWLELKVGWLNMRSDDLHVRERFWARNTILDFAVCSAVGVLFWSALGLFIFCLWWLFVSIATVLFGDLDGFQYLFFAGCLAVLVAVIGTGYKIRHGN